MATTDVRRSAKLVINPPRANEFEEWAALWRSYLAFYDAEKPGALYRRNWQRIHDTSSPLFCLFARRNDGSPLGLAHFLFQDSAWCEETVCYLQDLFVSEQFRGQGAGEALIRAVADVAKDSNSAKLYWLTQIENYRARELYDRVGRHTGFVKYELSLPSAHKESLAAPAVVISE